MVSVIRMHAVYLNKLRKPMNVSAILDTGATVDGAIYMTVGCTRIATQMRIVFLTEPPTAINVTAMQDSEVQDICN